jgi:uncharacterized membrane protein
MDLLQAATDAFLRGFSNGMMKATLLTHARKPAPKRKQTRKPKSAQHVDGLWMLVTTAAKVSKVPRRTVRRWVGNKELSIRTVRGKKYINVDELRSRYQ